MSILDNVQATANIFLNISNLANNIAFTNHLLYSLNSAITTDSTPIIAMKLVVLCHLDVINTGDEIYSFEDYVSHYHHHLAYIWRAR